MCQKKCQGWDDFESEGAGHQPGVGARPQSRAHTCQKGESVSSGWPLISPRML